ncbi:1049_t:CDS:2, partial [Rhizophagus irregularis]
SKRKQIMKKRRDINIEKANQLMKKSKNHSNKEVAESADKEVVVVNKKKMNKTDVAISSSSKITDKNLKKYEKTVSTGSLSQKELIDYVDEEFVQKILSQQLVAVNISELIRNGGFDILVDFIRETFKVEKFCPPLKN